MVYRKFLHSVKRMFDQVSRSVRRHPLYHDAAPKAGSTDVGRRVGCGHRLDRRVVDIAPRNLKTALSRSSQCRPPWLHALERVPRFSVRDNAQ